MLSRQVRSGKLAIEGAVYDIVSGNVNWMGAHSLDRQHEDAQLVDGHCPPLLLD